MDSISTRVVRAIFLVMLLLIGFNLLITIITSAKDDSEVSFIKMNINISRRLLRVRPILYRPIPPRANIGIHYGVIGRDKGYGNRYRNSPPESPSSPFLAPPPVA
ncbi:hypothetical protein C5167_040422 [Papaver somniferum]|uniref:Transmembrane protein n=1 Tax=Papaver somniferum TaxID=3469 RepID=A0A4Y7IIE9_PAPSO|nr:uncharacterized protein LOC113337069 [Papaver somniferum]RZC47482.1 hypothetical protein C5167_040422 [Papaver somniferum]